MARLKAGSTVGGAIIASLVAVKNLIENMKVALRASTSTQLLTVGGGTAITKIEIV